MSIAHNMLTFIGSFPFRPTKVKVHPLNQREPFFFALLPLDVQVLALMWADTAHEGRPEGKLMFTYYFARKIVSTMDIACCNKALRKPFLLLVRFMAAKSLIHVGHLICLHRRPTDDNAIYTTMTAHVQWLVNKGIPCDAVHLPKHPAALRALAKLAEAGVRMPTVTNAMVSLPADFGDAFRLFPNCTSFRFSLSPSYEEGRVRVDNLVSNLNEFIVKFPQVQLHHLTVWFPSSYDVAYELPDMAPHLLSYSGTLRTLEVFHTSTGTTTSPDDLITAACTCKALNRFSAFEYPIHTAHVLQLLNACPLLVDLFINKSSKASISLGDILWYTRSGCALKSLSLASEYDYDGMLVDGADAILQHLEKLIANHPSDCWDTVTVGREFKKCRTENSLRLSFSNDNASLLRENTDRLVGAIRSSAFITELSVVGRNNHDDDIATSPAPALCALTDFHEALNQPIKVYLFLRLTVLEDLSKRRFCVVTSLHIQTEFGKCVDDSALMLMVKTFPHLAEIHLDMSYMEDQITDKGMCALFAGCPYLKRAEFGDVPRVTERSLHAILANKLRLHKLTIHQASIMPNNIERFRKMALRQQFLPVPMITVETSINPWAGTAVALFNGGR